MMLLLAAALLAVQPAPAGAADPPPGQSFTLAWGGDVTPGSDYGLPPDSGRTMLSGVTDLLSGVDLAAVNLEGTLGRVRKGGERELLRVPGARRERGGIVDSRSRPCESREQPRV